MKNEINYLKGVYNNNFDNEYNDYILKVNDYILHLNIN